MSGMAKLLMIAGASIFIIGFLIQFLKLGKLPGDIVIKKGNTTFFPINDLYHYQHSVICYFLCDGEA